MQFEINWVFCVLVVLTGSSQTRGQSSALPPAHALAALLSHAGSSASPDPTEDPGYEVPQWTHNPAGRDETSTQTTTNADGSVLSETVTNTVTTSEPVVMTAHPAAADNLSSTPTVQSTSPPQHNSTTEGIALLTRDPLTTSSPQPAHTVQDTSPTANASTIQPQSESLTTATAQPTTTGHPLTSAAGWDPAGPTHQEVPPELNVGDEDLKGPRYRSSSPLDPLLAGLLSVFIVTTAVVFVILFLKFRQRTNHPEFHRLQDLPMDDLMEDTPLSRYSY
ncbi:soluble scavenger receptor cysteine-rich domain-containing protein SSC5D-like [Micropterus salmoides]|uniref:soluble scavenger receptor cysteine-rich domain-containing protein SSC5D-like n=1 Tax=Micropterus salmoides TaxID=27706 RepID=UPI0018ED529B|nr:soluble scavenger receptor cysteine-rich domain-containing protein SSC5D-like [Micropterus salmoides]